jgi:hypothetical protein
MILFLISSLNVFHKSSSVKSGSAAKPTMPLTKSGLFMIMIMVRVRDDYDGGDNDGGDNNDSNDDDQQLNQLCH